MSDTNLNTASNVAVGKPKITGAVYVGATSLTAPTTADEALASGFACLGYVSSDGLVISEKPTAEDIKAWGGDVVDTAVTEAGVTAKFTMIETLNPEVQKVVHSDANVSGALATGLTAISNMKEKDTKIFVFDTILRGAIRRIVIPRGKVSEVEDVTYKDDSAVGHGVTLKALADSAGNYKYEYTKAVTASSAST